MSKYITILSKALIFAISYYLSVQLGMLFIADSVAFFWPASGVACGFFIFFEKRLWPYFVVAFIPAYVYPLIQHGGYTNVAMGLLCLANLVQSLVAGFLIQRQANGPVDINKVNSLVRFIVLSAVVAPIVSALIGVPTLHFFFESLSFSDYFLFWVIGNCAGILPVVVFMSAVVKLDFNRPFFPNSMQYYYKRIGFVVAYIALIYWILAFGNTLTLEGKIIPYFIFPCILFSSIKFGVKCTGVLLLVFSCLAAFFAAQGYSPYISPSLPTIYNAISLDIFIIILTSTALVLAALKSELALAKEHLQEEKNEALELSRLKSQFIANINHEIRTPVTGIVGAVDLLSGSELSSDQYRLVSVVRDSCNYLLSLIGNVLEFSRLDNNGVDLEVKTFNLEVLVHGVIKSFLHMANEKGITIYVDCKTDKVFVESDSTAMKQVVGNLLANAIKFTSSGSIIVTIDVNDGLFLSVADTGIGISEGKTDKIFESFSQEDTSMSRKFGGAGLGLAIVKKIVSMMGGTISVESKIGEGSIFTLNFDFLGKSDQRESSSCSKADINIYSNDGIQSLLIKDYLAPKVASVCVHPWDVDAGSLYLDNNNAVSIIRWEGQNKAKLADFCEKITHGRYIFILPWFMDKPNCSYATFLYEPIYTQELLEGIEGGKSNINMGKFPNTAKPLKRPLDVLLVDDNAVNTLVVQSILEKRGCHVSLAENGRIAVDKAQGSCFDLILMDIQMPVMDGFAATRQIRGFSKAVPIVAFSANTTQQLVSEFEASGMNSVLPKPIDNALLDVILSNVSEGGALSFSDLGIAR